MADIIVGVDGSESAARALRWACREGELRGWSVTAELAWGAVPERFLGDEGGFDPNYGMADAREALRTYLERAVGTTDATSIDQRISREPPARALLASSTNASLLVVGGRGQGGFLGLLLGAVSHQLLHHAMCPVAVIREDHLHPSDPDTQRVVVGIDGSDNARRALQWAAEEARVRHASLEVVHAWHIPYAGDPYGAVAVDPAVFEAAARTTMDHALGAVDLSNLEHPAQPVLACDSPARSILLAAKGADCLVMGARGAGGFADLLVGSSTTQVVHHALCPVVVVPSVR